MIIACQSCNKKFDIDDNLIPEKGRLLQCNSCNHKWFFKNQVVVKTINPSTNERLEIFEVKKPIVNSSVDVDKSTINKIEITSPLEEIVKNVKVKKKFNFMNLIIVFLITFVALVILVDTFKAPINKIFPNIEFLLYNLYETIIDIGLFIGDLV